MLARSDLPPPDPLHYRGALTGLAAASTFVAIVAAALWLALRSRAPSRARTILALALGGALAAGVLIAVIVTNPVPEYRFTPPRLREGPNADSFPRAQPTQEPHR